MDKFHFPSELRIQRTTLCGHMARNAFFDLSLHIADISLRMDPPVLEHSEHPQPFPPGYLSRPQTHHYA
jgi:hypothetical protein